LWQSKYDGVRLELKALQDMVERDKAARDQLEARLRQPKTVARPAQGASSSELIEAQPAQSASGFELRDVFSTEPLGTQYLRMIQGHAL
jgi:hypothetical protein